MANLFARFTEKSITLPNDWWYGEEVNQLALTKLDDEALMPWDASFHIENGDLIITGSVFGHGIGGVTIKCPLRHAIGLYTIVQEDHNG
jgi:hypothetical protein